jgi:hypothetical protein
MCLDTGIRTSHTSGCTNPGCLISVVTVVLYGGEKNWVALLPYWSCQMMVYMSPETISGACLAVQEFPKIVKPLIHKPNTQIRMAVLAKIKQCSN